MEKVKKLWNRDAAPEAGRPVLIFDGDCNFCRFWVERWRDATGGRVDYRPFQAVAEEYPAIPREAFAEAVQWVEPGSSVTGGGEPGEPRVISGADAVFRALSFTGTPLRWMGSLVRAIPGGLALARLVYRFVARHRTGFGTLTRWLWGRALGRPTYYFSRWLFLRLLGVALFFAFFSLLLQVKGLIGPGGILPATKFFDAAHRQLGSEAYRLLPSVFWLGAGEAALAGACLAGIVLSLLVIGGWWPSLALLGAWALCLSLTVAGQAFLGYQWDALLLEATLLAIFLAPPFRARPNLADESFSGRLSRWLLLWLLFRLMFESGAVKLASGDPSWANLTALAHHYETQPLPMPTAWWIHHAPPWMHRASAFGMFAIELGAPFCLLLPGRFRLAAFFSLAGLQAMIAVTGNYAFFNFLSASLCVLMVEDRRWPVRWRKWAGFPVPPGGSRESFEPVGSPALPACGDPARPLSPRIPFERSQAGWPRWIVLPVAGVSVLVGGMTLAAMLRPGLPFPGWMEGVSSSVGPLRSFNRYGLFSVMTTQRPEIVIEGSNDGREWAEYEFRWKPGDPDRMPPIVAPHQPRLDWQMWFASLGTLQQNPWFLNLMTRILEGSPEVLGLLERNPFPEAPPRYLRAVLYRYHFTAPGEGTAWWRRERLGLYCPPATLRGR